jgi:tyrosyl-tRNA synthetase
MKSEFLRIAQERGFIHQCTDIKALDQSLASGPVVAYLGFDATAPSLHVGSLVGIMWLRWLQKTGHKPLVLVGGATTRIGDPSFRDESRKLMDDSHISQNIQGIQKVFNKFLTFGDGGTDAVLVNNLDWLGSVNYIDFLRDFGSHFSVNRMLSFDSVRLRLEREQSLSFLEFNYMILQAYDFWHLHKTYGCMLQLGGSDQWGNIVNGVELVRRLTHQTVYGLTTPLITTASGAKMGKSAAGAVWLNEDMLSPYDYWQFWRNTDDRDVGRYLRLFTELPLAEIEKLENLQGAELNEAKKILANEATTLAHGAAALPAIHQTIGALFEQGAGDLNSLPQFEIDVAELPIAVDEAFMRCGLTASKGEGRRLIQGGGARLNDQPVTDIKQVITRGDFNAHGTHKLKLSAGKKKHACLMCC